MAAKTSYLSNEILDHLLRNETFSSVATLYLAMFTADPTTTGDQTNEVSGGSYSRQSIAFDAAASQASANTSAVNFGTASASWGTVTHWGIMDASSGGNMLYFGEWDTAKAVNNGDTVEIPAGQVQLSEI